MGPISAEVASSPVWVTRLSAEDAWELALRLERLLDCLAADAVGPERREFRLAGALAGSLADELEAIVQRRVQRQQGESGSSHGVGKTALSGVAASAASTRGFT
jgi:hypothetical protein